MIGMRRAIGSTMAAAVKRAMPRKQMVGKGRNMSSGNAEQEAKDADLITYAGGFAAGVALFGIGRYISQANKAPPREGTKVDYSSQEFRDQSMNQGMIEACAGGLEWGGIAWAGLAVAQALENRFSKNPFLSVIGPPRIALLVMGAACAGFAIRGEEKLIGAARKPLLEKADKQ